MIKRYEQLHLDLGCLELAQPCVVLLLPRHPSQLYEAGLEGLVLFVLLYALVRRGALERTGTLSGAFMIGYGLARLAVEFVRQPDEYLGFLTAGATMGQLLSLPMVLIGLWLVVRARRDS